MTPHSPTSKPRTDYGPTIRILSTLPARTRVVRERRGLSRTQLANRTGLTYPTIRAIELGRLPNVTTALLILEWLNLPDPEPTAATTNQATHLDSPGSQPGPGRASHR